MCELCLRLAAVDEEAATEAGGEEGSLDVGRGGGLCVAPAADAPATAVVAFTVLLLVVSDFSRYVASDMSGRVTETIYEHPTLASVYSKNGTK